MKKIKLQTKSELDYEIIFKETSKWCPLFGFLPDINQTSLAQQPKKIYYGRKGKKGFTTAYLAEECLKVIKKVRGQYWNIKRYDLIEVEPCPAIDKLPHIIDNQLLPGCKYRHGEAINRARILFQNVHNLAWGSWLVSDIRTSTRRTEPPKYNIMKTCKPEFLLASAQCCLGYDYGATCLSEIYSIFMIHEAWCLLHGAISGKYKTSDIRIIHESLDYIDEIEKVAKLHLVIRMKAMQQAQKDFTEIMRQKAAKIGKETKSTIKNRDNVKKAYVALDIKNLNQYTRHQIAGDIFKHIQDQKIPVDFMSIGTIKNHMATLEQNGEMRLPDKRRTGPKKSNSKI